MSDYYGGLLAKYEGRGWKSQDVLWPEDQPSHRSMLKVRRLGDRFTWIIPLDTGDVEHAATPDSVLEYANWKLIAHDPDASLHHY